MVRSRFGEICSCSCLPALAAPAWVFPNYLLHTILCTSVKIQSIKIQCVDKTKWNFYLDAGPFETVIGENETESGRKEGRRGEVISSDSSVIPLSLSLRPLLGH